MSPKAAAGGPPAVAPHVGYVVSDKGGVAALRVGVGEPQ
jgi:hypothetical protein